MKVTSQVKVPLAIGKYEDEVLCDVLPMDAGHILLGRPWQSDRKVIHEGFTNRYSFVFKGRKTTLIPMTPQEVYKDQLHLQQQKDQKVKGKDKVSKQTSYLMKAGEFKKILYSAQPLHLSDYKGSCLDLTNLEPVLPSKKTSLLQDPDKNPSEKTQERSPMISNMKLTPKGPNFQPFLGIGVMMDCTQDHRLKPPDLGNNEHLDVHPIILIKQEPPDAKHKPTLSPDHFGGKSFILHKSVNAYLSFVHADRTDSRSNPFQVGGDDVILTTDGRTQGRTSGRMTRLLDERSTAGPDDPTINPKDGQTLNQVYDPALDQPDGLMDDQPKDARIDQSTDARMTQFMDARSNPRLNHDDPVNPNEDGANVWKLSNGPMTRAHSKRLKEAP